MSDFTADVFGEIYRREAGRCLATLVRVLGNVDLAEDAVAEAFAIAAKKWPADGFPPNPGGWLTTTARNRAIDDRRRESKRHERQVAADQLMQNDQPAVADIGPVEVVPDDQLRLFFLCCHPALRPEAQVALTLRLLGGLQTGEIARAFLVPETTMAQRIVRAKRKIRDNHIAYRIPEAADLSSRLVPVLGAIYLIFNEAYAATAGSSLMRPKLAAESIRLARVVVELLPDEAEARGLLALLLLSDARSPARLDEQGNLVRLADQDRTRWKRVQIDEGHELVRACIEQNEPGVYQVQAAIAAVHAHAASAEATDWAQIVALYDHLHELRSNEMVMLNRAIAVGELHGPQAALDALDVMTLDGYHLLHAARAEQLRLLGRVEEARVALRRSLALCSNEIESRHLHAQLEALDGLS